MVYDKDDEDADMAYEAVQKRMQDRRKAQREAREQAEAAEYLKNNPRIQDRFSDLKRGLSEVSDDQWEGIPEASNFTGKRRKKEVGLGRTYVVPDTVLVSGRDKNTVEASLDEKQMVRSSVVMDWPILMARATGRWLRDTCSQRRYHDRFHSNLRRPNQSPVAQA